MKIGRGCRKFEVVLALGALAALPLRAATIEWEEARNIGADTDVSTEGELICAYNENGVDATVNGVLFRGYTSHGLLPVGAVEPDAQLATFGESRANTFLGAFASSASFSEPYRNLLAGAAFNRNANTTGTVTLLGLQPGEEYLVQVWINDNRSNIDIRSYTMVLDGVCSVETHPENADYGQYTIGRFRADSSSQVISISCTRSPIINAFQLRKLPSIAWGEPQPTGDGSEVNNSGTTLYAYHFAFSNDSNPSYVVNGVAFSDGGYGGVKMSANVGLSHDGGEGRDFRASNGGMLDFKTVYPEGTPESYKTVLGCGLYLYLSDSAAGGAWTDMTLKNLVPGRKYVVQMWYVDARYENETCTIYQKIDGVRSLFAYDSANGHHGQTVTGEFVATSTNKTIRVRGYNISPSWRNNSLLNAFQVRDITEIPEGGQVIPLSAESAVRTDGEPVYAYTASSADLTVNGVAFAAQSSWTSWGGGNVQLTGFTARNDSVFHPNASTGFEKLLAAGVYARHYEVNNKNPAPASLTFNGLVPLSPYLIQVFVNDSREGSEDRRVKFGDNGTFTNYQSCCALVVRPETSSHTLNLWYTADAAGNISPQVNAVQVRRLPETTGDSLVWSGGASGAWSASSAGWTGSGDIPANPWSAENGVARDAVIGDGTTLTVSDGVTARNLIAQGALTLNGYPTLTGEIMGGDVTVASALTVETIVKTYDGLLTFSGDRSQLRQATVTRGVLALTANDSSDLRRVFVGESGTLKLCGTGRIVSGTVSGTLETSGALTASSDVEFAAGWVLRRTNGAAMTVDCETFDLSSIASVHIPDSAAFCAGTREVLRTTGSFTGTIPRLDTDKKGFQLEVVHTQGGDVLKLKSRGLFIMLR